MLPIIAVSVIDIRGSAMPAIKAGIASLFILLKLISVFKTIIIFKTQSYNLSVEEIYINQKNVPLFYLNNFCFIIILKEL